MWVHTTTSLEDFLKEHRVIDLDLSSTLAWVSQSEDILQNSAVDGIAAL